MSTQSDPNIYPQESKCKPWAVLTSIGAIATLVCGGFWYYNEQVQGTADNSISITTSEGDNLKIPLSSGAKPADVVKEEGGVQELKDGTQAYDFTDHTVYTGFNDLTVVERGEGYTDLYYNTETSEFVTYAQELRKPFTEAESKCSLAPLNEVNLTGQKTTWVIPGLGTASKTKFSQTSPVYLPSSPGADGTYGTWYADSAPLFSETGAGIYLGHVNYGPGVLSAFGGEASTWGMLHKIEPCMRKYITDENGNQREYVAVEARQVKASEIESNPEYWATDGDNVIFDITCAGPSGFGDDGQGGVNYVLGDFPLRIVIKYKPVEV